LESTNQLKILEFVGSLRVDSYDKALMSAAIDLFPKHKQKLNVNS